MRTITLVFLAVSCTFGIFVQTAQAQSSEQKLNDSPIKVAIPEGHAYAGAYIDFGEREDAVTLEAIERFDALVGKQQAMVAFSNDWGIQTFPEKQLRIISNYGALPLVYWLPWDRPVGSNPPVGPGRFDLNSILAGKWDSYIDGWAIQAKGFGKPFFVAWGIEMNGFWFPWSGYLHGKGKPLKGCAHCFAGPEKFKSAYRYVVDRVRAQGASNILWVWHANNTSDPDQPWNAMTLYYPGPQYADWLALSAYGTQYAVEGWVTVDAAVGSPYKTLCQVDENKPLMLAEWGVGEFPKAGSKAKWIADFFEHVPKDYPRIRGIVFWHERWQNADQSISNLRVNSSAEALEAYRRGVSSPFWLSRPLFN